MDNKPVKLISVGNNIEAELIINLLQNNNIQCLKISKEAGEYMNIYMGYSIFGEDIYVNESDYQAAMELLKELSDNEELLLDDVGENEIDEDYDVNDETIPDIKIPFYKKSKIVLIIILLVMLGIIILSVIGY